MTVTSREQAEGAAVSAAAPRPRPRVHFTAVDGWINDPYGITWLGDRYQMFYQAVPGRTTWSPACAWGSAESPDLVRWRELPPALAPQAFEVGCWSGSVVLDVTPPRLFYTRIADEPWSDGRIATATGDATLRTWSSGIEDLVVAEPPHELGVTTFRDPYVFRHDGSWIMVVGAGLADGSGAVVQYRSDDLATWTCDGLLCSRASHGDVATGQVWECPQLFPFGDEWVLLVSVWDDDELYHVAAARGDYDGSRFRVRSWQQLTYGSSAYAMTAFLDKDGRRCVMSWLREEPRNDPARVGWVGAHSIAALVTAGLDGALVLTPHPDLAALAVAQPVVGDVEDEIHIPIVSGAAELTLRPTAGSSFTLNADAGELMRVEFGDDQMTVSRPGAALASMPIDTALPLTCLVDADIVELFGPAGYGAFRVAVARAPATTEVVISRSDHQASIRML